MTRLTPKRTTDMFAALRADEGLSPQIREYWDAYREIYSDTAKKIEAEVAALRLARRHGPGLDSMGGHSLRLADHAVYVGVDDPEYRIWRVKILHRLGSVGYLECDLQAGTVRVIPYV